MKIGEAFQLTISTRAIYKSLRFYQALGFKEISGDSQPFPWRIIADPCLTIMLNDDGREGMKLTWYDPDFEDKAPLLAARGVKFAREYDFDKLPGIVEMVDPDGNHHAVVIRSGEDLHRPEGPTLADLKGEDFGNPEKYPNKKIGILGEIAFPVENLGESIKFWENFGFDQMSLNDHPYPWAIMRDEHIVIGLHESAHFPQPAITYFAPDQAANMAALRAAGLEEQGEILGEDDRNQTLLSPEEQLVFLFSIG